MENQAQTKRPDFLTVLCALSFVNAGYHIISDGLINMFTSNSEKAVEQMEEAMAQMPDDSPGFLSGFMESSAEMAIAAAENAIPMGLSIIVVYAVSALGTFFMFKQQKKGFGIYAIANVVSLAIPIIFLGASGVVLASVGVAAFFTILFIVLYSLNLKHMS